MAAQGRALQLDRSHILRRHVVPISATPQSVYNDNVVGQGPSRATVSRSDLAIAMLYMAVTRHVAIATMATTQKLPLGDPFSTCSRKSCPRFVIAIRTVATSDDVTSHLVHEIAAENDQAGRPTCSALGPSTFRTSGTLTSEVQDQRSSQPMSNTIPGCFLHHQHRIGICAHVLA